MCAQSLDAKGNQFEWYEHVLVVPLCNNLRKVLVVWTVPHKALVAKKRAQIWNMKHWDLGIACHYGAERGSLVKLDFLRGLGY
jgi:hypothetical protein